MRNPIGNAGAKKIFTSSGSLFAVYANRQKGESNQANSPNHFATRSRVYANEAERNATATTNRRAENSVDALFSRSLLETR